MLSAVRLVAVQRHGVQSAVAGVACGSSVLRRAYHERVIDHYENPRNVGSLNKSDVGVGTGLVGAPSCGDVMKLQIRVDDNGIIQEVKQKTFGCGSAIASSSVVSEWLVGKHIDEAMKIKNSDIAQHLSLPPVKLHCSMLAEDAVKAAYRDYKSKQQRAAAAVAASASAAQAAQPGAPKA